MKALEFMTDTDPALLAARSTSPPVIAIIGLGYVGLPTAISLASSGVSVIGIDIQRGRLTSIRDGDVDLIPNDRDRLAPALASGLISLSDDASAITDADVIVICVPTPVDRHRVPDLGAMRSACRSVIDHVRPGQTIILTSTSYVGTTRDLLVTPLADAGWTIGVDVFVAFSPERIDPGNQAFAQENVPRVVGGVTDECAKRAAAAVGLVSSSVHIVTSPEAAELTKLYENIFRAVNIALANEISDIAGSLGLDISEVIEAAATKPHGFMPFQPGAGVGGHCIPCDPHYLLWQLRSTRFAAPMIETAMNRIAARPGRVVSRAIELLGRGVRPVAGARIVVVGVAYKAEISDCRESSALEIIETLKRAGARVEYFDPLVEHVILDDGKLMTGLVSPEFEPWDLAIVHTRHSSVDHEWLDRVPVVLDATFQMEAAPNRAVV